MSSRPAALLHTDVLVLGNGGAGLRAAIEARRFGAEVTIAARTILGKAHTTMAEGGLNAALGNTDPGDSYESHFSDTVREGAFLNDQRLVETLVKEAPHRVRDLEGFGALFDRLPDGRLAQRPFGGQSHPRTCHLGDETGHEIVMALVEEVRRQGIRHLDEILVTRLLAHEGRCVGAVGVEMRSGDPITLLAKATVLCLGGAGRIFKVTSNPEEANGDGYSMAYAIGAELMDMEQVQFHPTGMVSPESARGVLVTEAARSEGGILLNSKGERFMACYDPERMELAPRDVVARAIDAEVKGGRGTASGGAYLDLTHISPERIEASLPRMRKQFLTFAKLDIARERLEVAPTQHHFMGGVKVRPEDCGSTTVEGLYIAGECMAGVHGGNRLGGNALAETQVFGARAGQYAAEMAKASGVPEAPEAQIEEEASKLSALFRSGTRPQTIRRRLQEMMWQKAGIIRDAKGLGEAMAELQELRSMAAGVGVAGNRGYNLEWFDAISLPGILMTAECVLRSAILRRESRGAHFRSDHPSRDDARWLVNITLFRGEDGAMLSYTTPVQMTKMRPEASG